MRRRTAREVKREKKEDGRLRDIGLPTLRSSTSKNMLQDTNLEVKRITRRFDIQLYVSF